MCACRSKLFALVLLCLPGFVAGAERWTQLKLGMTPEETVAALGEPLFRTAGRGFELWIYDERAEVVFYGPLIGWTAPHPDSAAGLTNDVWVSDHSGAPTPTFLSQLPRPILKPDTARHPPDAVAYVWLPVNGFRR